MQSIIYISNNDDFLVIDLAKEYSNYKDSIPYAIVTDLSEEYLNTTYGDEIKKFTPFIILTHEMFEAMEDSFINDEKERIRGYFYHDPTPVEDIDIPADKMSDPAFELEANETAAFIINKMRSLPRTEGRRLYMKYVLGLETDEIAHLEKVCPEAIRNSLRRGLAHVYQLFENSEVINNDKNN